MSTLYVNNIEPVSGSSLTLISASLVSVDNLSVASLTSSFQGDLTGTASFAVTASHALNSTSAAGTEGQVQFNSGSDFGADSNLFWDNTNKRLGVGTNAPTTTLNVVGQTTFSDNAFFSNDFKYIGRELNRSSIRFASISSEIRANMVNGGQFQVYNTQTALYPFTVSSGGQTTISGGGSTSETTSLLVQNSSGTELLKVRDDNKIFLGGSASHYIESGYNFVGSYYWINEQIVRAGIVNDIGSVKIIDDLNVGGNTNNNNSAILQADSTTKGFLPPRMTTTQKNAISSPAAGLMVYDTDTNKLCCYNGTSWNDLF